MKVNEFLKVLEEQKGKELLFSYTPEQNGRSELSFNRSKKCTI